MYEIVDTSLSKRDIETCNAFRTCLIVTHRFMYGIVPQSFNLVQYAFADSTSERIASVLLRCCVSDADATV